MKSLISSMALALSLCLPCTSAFSADRVELWISAFIPSAHPKLPNYIRMTSSGTYVLDAPIGGTCFETDNREFSSSPTASARVRVRIILDVAGPNMSLVKDGTLPEKFVGESHNVDCKTGQPVKPPAKAGSHTIEIGDIKKGNFTRTLFVKAAVANPYFPHIDLASISKTFGPAPDIDFSAYFSYDVRSGKIEIKGTAGYFPSFEGYYSVNGAEPVPFLQIGPYEDSTALSLYDGSLGVNTRNFSGIIDLR